MKREDIIRMAQEAGFEVHERKQQARIGVDALLGVDSTEKLQRFAASVAAAEREACADAARELLTKGRSPLGKAVHDAIMARSNAVVSGAEGIQSTES